MSEELTEGALFLKLINRKVRRYLIKKEIRRFLVKNFIFYDLFLKNQCKTFLKEKSFTLIFQKDLFLKNKKPFLFNKLFKTKLVNVSACNRPNFVFLHKIINISLHSLITNNFFLGNFLRKSNFFFANFFLGFRSKFVIFNLEYTILLLRTSINFLVCSFVSLGSKNTSLIYSKKIYLMAFFSYLHNKKDDVSFFLGKWVFGFLTNFEGICIFLKDVLIKGLINLKSHKNRVFLKRLKGLKDIFLPFFVLFSEVSLDTREIILETFNLKMPNIGLMDSNEKNYNIVYPIPCNSESPLSVKCFFILHKRCIFYYKVLMCLKRKKVKTLSRFLALQKLLDILPQNFNFNLNFFKSKKRVKRVDLCVLLYKSKEVLFSSSIREKILFNLECPLLESNQYSSKEVNFKFTASTIPPNGRLKKKLFYKKQYVKG